MTYMSIRDSIKARCNEGKLFLLEPQIPGERVARTMFLSPEVFRLVCGEWVDDKPPWDDPQNRWKVRCSQLRQQLEDFITGGLISVARKPRAAKTAYMSQLDMPSDRVWDIRAREPNPGVRIIGSFAEVDVFVGVVWKLRKPLGDYRSQEWKDAIAEFHGEWGTLFGLNLPISDLQEISEDNLHDYISNDAFILG